MMEDNDFLKHDDPSDALTECAENFIGGKYGRCAEQAMEIMQRWGIGVLQAQLAMMSYQRLGKSNSAHQIADAFLDRRDMSRWEKTLIQISLGRAAAKSVLESPPGKQRCQAYFYYANALVTEGKYDEARGFLQVCLNEAMKHREAVSLDEAGMAQRQLDRWPPVPAETGNDPEKLLAKAEDLMSQKRYQEALDYYDFVIRRHAEVFESEKQETLRLIDNWEDETLSLMRAWGGKLQTFNEWGKTDEVINCSFAFETVKNSFDHPPVDRNTYLKMLHPEREQPTGQPAAQEPQKKKSWWRL